MKAVSLSSAFFVATDSGYYIIIIIIIITCVAVLQGVYNSWKSPGIYWTSWKFFCKVIDRIGFRGTENAGVENAIRQKC